ncbi:substrate-binding domain-containing protein [Agrobacterium sp. AGB01]|uniref:substrate-binding domain-containing protein n=1 Tax=Agrobacterium sp. AGB01 TaxID=2769302 RepID=UPI001783768B|nr:substrate-binding domain-containing protein [Agrobacterium sp. AGB01]
MIRSRYRRETLAAGVLQELHQARLRVPDDVSVIGFDHSIADMLTPPLSSVGRPCRKWVLPHSISPYPR